MTKVTLIYKDRVPCGFEITGHSTEGVRDTTGKTVCAAVSSAAYMTANTVTDIIGEKCRVSADDGCMSLTLEGEASEKTVAVMEGFALHITGLSKQYPQRIKLLRRCKRNVKDKHSTVCS